MSIDTSSTTRRMQKLHEQVEALGLTSPAVNVAVHALIEAGYVKDLVCADPNCKYPGQSFDNGGRRNPLGLSLDHVKLQSEGGSHRPWNIRLVHYACNCGWLKQQERPLHGAMVQTARLLKATRTLQAGSYGKDPAELDGDELKDYLRTNLLALQVEIGELAQELRWKPWKNKDESAVPTEDERYDVLMELVDCIFFYFNIAAALRVTASEIVHAYAEKYEINELRMLVALGNKLAQDQLPPPKPAPCDLCDQVFDTGVRGLAVHVTKAHKEQPNG